MALGRLQNLSSTSFLYIVGGYAVQRMAKTRNDVFMVTNKSQLSHELSYISLALKIQMSAKYRELPHISAKCRYKHHA